MESYKDEITKAAEALAATWWAEDAGEHADEATKFARTAIDRIASEFRCDRKEVAREVKRKAMEIYRED